MFFQPELFVPYKDGLIRLVYDDPSLKGAPAGIKEMYASRHNLPETCFCALKEVNMVLLTKYGESGYCPVENIPEGMGAEEYADTLNQMMGVSKAQQTAMLYGSMFGWDIPAARPERYDENGIPILRKQKRDTPER